MNNTFRFIIIWLSLSLLACGDGHEAFQVQHDLNTDNGSTQKTPLISEDGETTEKEIEVKTTISGSPELYKLAKKQTAEHSKKLDANNEERLDKDLSHSIFNVEINKIKRELFFKLSLNENNQKNDYNFSYKLKGNEHTKDLTKLIYQPRLSIKNKVSYNIKITCYNEDCSKANIFLIKCSKSAAGVCDFKNPDLKMAGLFYSQTQAYAKVAQAANSDSEGLKNLSKFIAEKSKVIKKSVVVINGPSFSDIKIINTEDKKEINIHTDNLDTTQTEIEAVVEDKNSEHDLDITLARNNPETGVLVFDIKKKNKKQVRVYISEKEIQESDITNPINLDLNSLENLYQNAYINPLLISEASKATTLKFEKYRQTKKLKEFIDHWTGQTNMNYCNRKYKNGAPITRKGSRMRKRLISFFNYSQPLRETVYKVADHLNVTSDFLYLAPSESVYTRSANYKFEISPSKNSTASGPFQVTDETAFDIRKRLKVKDVEIKLYRAEQLGKNNKGEYPKRLNANDDRRFFETSALLSARYTKSILKQFNDPALWPLAYHRGPGGVGNLSRRLAKDNETFNESLLDVDRYTPKFHSDLCHQVRYALDTLAIRFIASNLKKYNFELDESLNDESRVPTLYRPTGSVLK